MISYPTNVDSLTRDRIVRRCGYRAAFAQRFRIDTRAGIMLARAQRDLAPAWAQMRSEGRISRYL